MAGYSQWGHKSWIRLSDSTTPPVNRSSGCQHFQARLDVSWLHSFLGLWSRGSQQGESGGGAGWPLVGEQVVTCLLSSLPELVLMAAR